MAHRLTAPPHVLGMKHGAKTRQQAVIQHATQPGNQFTLGGAQTLRGLLERPFAYREAALQIVDDVAVQFVHQ